MEYRILEGEGKKLVECLPAGGRIGNEKDALELVAICGENECSSLLIHGNNLTADFFHLRTGIAGDILLRFVIYRLKVALVLSVGKEEPARFKEMAAEANRGNQFHVCHDRSEAETWLLQE